MSGKLDQSLDDILKTRKQSGGRPARRAAAAKATAAVAPVGGVKKNTKAARPIGKIGAIPSASAPGESKIIVSNLPSDVNETQIKDYFSKTIGPVKKVFLTYGPNGQSRGISTIVFSKRESAAEAASSLNGVKVDNRSMKIEVIVGADQAPAPPPVKSLTDRIRQPKAAKAQPKSAAAPAKAATAAAGSRGRRQVRGRNAGRPKPKTSEELDAEMQDYFNPADGAGAGAAPTTANGGATAPAATNGGDAGMEDEIM